MMRVRSLRITDASYREVERAAMVLGVTASKFTRLATVTLARKILSGVDAASESLQDVESERVFDDDSECFPRAIPLQTGPER